MKRLIIIKLLLLSLVGCGEGNQINTKSSFNKNGTFETATFAGGCFWCIEAPFEGIDGVESVVSGYSGGKEKNPTYSQVSSGRTGHTESVQITYNPDIISYSELLDLFWKQFDPTDAGGSFYDRGPQYRSAIFYHSNEQKMIAEKSKMELNNSGKFDKSIVTEIVKFRSFYPAEEYHQDYYKKETAHYKKYRNGSGRDKFITRIWGDWKRSEYKKPSTEIIKTQLNDEQYWVTQEEGTEPSFNNAYWNNKEKGIYVDVVSGEPLFSSKDKFRSGTGWPSFAKPIDVRYISKVIDNSFGMPRVEVRSRFGDSHLGHVFNDGPESTNLRYCMNSASLRFIPKDEMVDKGYGAYLWLVE